MRRVDILQDIDRLDLFDAVPAIILLLDEKGRILYFNAFMEALGGYTLKQARGRNWFELFLPERDRKRIQGVFADALGGSATHGNINAIVTKSGEERLIRWYDQVMNTENEGRHYLLATGVDITELEHERELVKLSEHKFRTLIDALPQGVFMKAPDLSYVACNVAHARFLGLDGPRDAIGRRDEELHPPELARKYQADDRQVIERGETIDMEETAAIDGREVTVQTVKTPVRDRSGNITGVLGIYWDISQRKRAEQALAAGERRFRQLFENMPSAFAVHEIICDGEGKPADYRFLEVNPAFETLTGIPADGLVGRTVLEVLPGTEPHWIDIYGKVALTGEPVSFQNYAQALGRHYDVRAFSPHPGQFATIFSDVTGQKAAAHDLEHANRALKTLSTVNRELVHASDEDDLLQAICTAIVEHRGYRMAWVGYERDNADKDVEVVASAGMPSGLMQVLQPGWGDDARAAGPTGRAIRTGEAQLSRDIASEPYHAWKDAVLKAGCASSIALPLKDRSDQVFGVLHVYSGELDAFADREIALLEEMAGDLAFGIDVLRVRRERDEAMDLNERHLAQASQNLEDTITAISKAAEARDPYTAGHQRRVADLAVAIGRRMGLDAEKVHGIHMGGTIHDIGKINIPAEILSKPSRLNEMEMLLVREHSQVGYDILKDIHFPWPVAEVAHQHHERLDGSGYPQGLKGDEICLEARIVAVADVVEAMSSHRPYRPGLGHEAALAEIRDKRSRFYDADVVDACLDVFANGFRFD